MLNRTILVGRLTRDPELRYTQDGVAVASFNLAVQRRYNREQTDFIVLGEKTPTSTKRSGVSGR